MTPRIVTVDFETEGIQARPSYPPKPVGVAVLDPALGRKPRYLAWGHPSGNTHTKRDAGELLRGYWKDPSVTLLFHHAKFDLDVADVHLGLPLPAFDKFEDTLLLAFLDAPDADALSLKPLAEKLLGEPPTERDTVRDWVQTNVPEVKRAKSKWGAHISKAPPKLVGPYACGDVTRTLKLFKLLHPRVIAAGMAEAYTRERRLVLDLLQDERAGVPIFAERLANDAKVWEHAEASVDEWIRKRLGAKSLDVNKAVQLADAIESAGLVEEWIVTEKTGARSTSIEDLAEVVSDFTLVHALAYRAKLVNALRTFARPWLAMAATSPNGRTIYTQWQQVRNANEWAQRQVGARTGRLTTLPNFQNIQKRPLPVEAGRAKRWASDQSGIILPASLRKHLPVLPNMRDYIGERGSLVCAADYSQQELRILAHYEDADLAAAYRKNPKLDQHGYARGLINASLGTSFARTPIKTIGFGIIYGMGIGLLSQRIGQDGKIAKQIRTAYKSIFPGIKKLEDDLRERARNQEPFRTLGGRVYYCEEPKSINGVYRTFEYKMINTLIQGSAADMTKEAKLRLSEATRDTGGRILLTAHDELVGLAKTKQAPRFLRAMRDAMESVPLDVPLLTDGKIGPTWASAEKVK